MNVQQAVEEVAKRNVVTAFEAYLTFSPCELDEAHAIQRSLFKREFFVLKAHGDAETPPEQIILTERDYGWILLRWAKRFGFFSR